MGMSTHVVGFKPPDADWKKMKAVWDACTKADLPIPEKVERYFNGEVPDDVGVSVNKDKMSSFVKEYSDDYREGYEVDVTKIPKDIKIIRFYNSH